MDRLRSWLRRLLAPALAGVVALLCAAESAQAAVWQLRPDGTAVAQSWSSAPDPAQPLHAVMNEPVLQPTVIGMLDPHMRTDGSRNNLAEVTAGTIALRPGENVVAVTAWVFAAPSDARDINYRIRIGATENLHAGRISHGGPTGWYSTRYVGTLSQTQVDNLRLRFEASGSSSGSEPRVYAMYLDVETDMPPPAPFITAAPRSPGSATAAAWSFTAEGASGSECRLVRGATVLADWATCASPRMVDLTGQPDGVYDFVVRSFDPLGLRSPETRSTYELDTTPPAVPLITAAPSSPSAGATPSWSFTVDANATAECRLDRDGTEVVAWAACTSPRSYDLSSRSDGAYRFRVRARDAAGNVGAEATSDYVLDRTPPPAPTVDAGPSGATNDPGPSFAFTAEAGAGLACRLDRGSTVVSGWAPCSSPHGYDLAAEPDGSYTFRVRATDAAGNTGSEATRSLTLDRAPPAAPSITDGPAATSSDATPTYTFSGEAGARLECRLERGVLTVEEWTTCTSPRTYDLAAEPDAAYTFRVRAIDAAGNAGAAASRTSTLDRSAPAAPTITAAPAADTRFSTAEVAFSGEAGATYACRLERSGTPVADWAACTSPRSYDLAAEPDGAYAFRVKATDTAGNTGAEATATFTLDRVVPDAPTVTAGPPAITNDPAFAWSFTAAEGTTTCRLDRDGSVVNDWSPCASPRSFDLAAAPDGGYTFRVRTTDAAGNTSSAASSSATLDRAAPPAPAFTAAPAAASSDATPTWSFTAETGTTTTCRLLQDGTEIAAWAACASPDTRDLGALPDGTYALEARATDVAGNTGPVASSSFRLDRAAPAAPSITGAPAAESADDTPTFAFSAEAGASLSCRLDDAASAPVRDWAACTSPVTYDLAAAPDGSYTFRVRATDAAGNTSPEATRTYVLDRVSPSGPTITSAPAAHSSDAAPSWSFTNADAVAFTCRVDREGGVVADWAACTSPAVYDLSASADGLYTFSVRAQDGAGNISEPASSSFVLDRAAPAAPSITAGPPAQSNDATPAWSFSGEAGASFACRLERAGTPVRDWAACSSPRDFDLAAEPDGSYTFLVRATDAAGNTGTAASATYELDRAAPDAPVITAAPTGPSQDAEPQWSFTAEAGAATACRLERDGAVVADWASCASPRRHDLRTAPDGTYAFRVRATDAAGNTSATTTSSYELDRTAPAAPVVTAGPASPSNVDAPQWSFTSESGTTTECRLDRDGTEVRAWAACTSPRAHDLTAEPDGVYAFGVRAVDAAGNRSATATASYRLDRTAPDAPVIDNGPPSRSSDATPRWTFTHEGGAAAECRLDRGATTVRDWAPCATAYEPDLTAEPDGEHTFAVRATDAAGNRSASATWTYTLDREAPSPAEMVSGPPAHFADATPEWSFTVPSDTTAWCRLTREGVTVSELAPCTSPRGYDLAAEPDGTYTFAVVAIDGAGNAAAEATASATLDRVAPAAPSITDGPSGRSTDGTPTWSFTGEAGASFACRLDRGTTEIAGWRACASPVTFDLSGEPDGDYVVQVRALDAAGNTGPATAAGFTLDRLPPPAPVITSGPPASSSSTAPAWTFTAEDGATTACRLERGTAVVADWAACTSPAGYDLAAEPDGAYTFRVRATDAAGGTGDAASASFTLDRVAPAAPVFVLTPAERTNDTDPVWEVTAEADATFQCRIDRGMDVVAGWEPCARTHSFSLALEPDGAYTYSVRAIDVAGNVGEAATDGFTLDREPPAAPVFTSGPAAETNDATVELGWTGEDGATSACRLERDGTVVSDWAPCASPLALDLTAEPDGGYGLSVRDTDAAGNVGAVAARTWSLDRTAPAVPVIDGGPDAVSRDATPAWSFTAAGATGTECAVERSGVVVVAWASCTSPYEADLSAEADGVYEVQIRALDAAGNRSAAATSSYALDRQGPAAPTFTGGPSGPTSDGTPEWSFTAEDGARTDCRLERDGVEVAAWASCASPYGPDLTGAPDGAYTVQVRATDVAGNVGDVASRTAELDRVAPAAPTVGGGPAAVSTDDTPSWSFNAEAGATVACRLLRDATVVSGSASCTSPASYDLTSAPDGTYTFEARATDAAGNTSAAGTASYTLDRSVPDAPSFTATPPAAGSATDPAWSFRTPDATTAECRVRRGDLVLAAWSACGSPRTVDLAAEPDGEHQLDVRSVNAAGTRSATLTGSYRLDRAAPAAPVITAGPPAASPATDPQWSWTAEDGAASSCRLERGSTVVVTWTACTSPRRYDLSGEPDGVYTFRVRATDAAGNTGADASSQFTLDRTLPPAPTFTDRPATPTRSRTPTWAFTGSGGAFECRLSRNGTPMAAWASCTSPYTASLTGEADATFAFEVRERNAAGTAGPAAKHEVVLDTAAPPAPVLTADPGATGRASTPRWAFTAEPGATTECRLELGETAVRPWAACTSPREYGLAGEPDGSYRFSVRARDAAGNVGAVTAHLHVLDRVAPAPPALTGPGPVGTDRAPQWAIAAEAGSRLECRADRDGAPLLAWAPCATPYVLDLGAAPDGRYAVAVRASDAAGNTSAEAAGAYTLDTTAGAVQILGGPGAVGRDRNPAWRFASAEAGAALQCRLDRPAGPLVEWQACISPFEADLTGQADGPVRLVVRAIDALGNLSAETATDYVLDTTAPAAPKLDREPASPGTDPSPTWRFTAEAGSTLTCRVERRGDGPVQDWTICASPFSADLHRQPFDSFRFLVRARDAAGNTGPAATGRYVLEAPAEPPPANDGQASRAAEPPAPAPAAPAATTAPPPAPDADAAGATAAERRDRDDRRRRRGGRERRAQTPAASPARRRRLERLADRARTEASARGRTALASRPRRARRSPLETAPAAVAEAVTRAASVVAEHPDKSAFPVSLLLLVLGFFGVQGRIDRSDPKLALAPLRADPDLEFPIDPDPTP